MKPHEQEWAAVPASATGGMHELHHGEGQHSCTPWGIDEDDFAELRLVAAAPDLARALLAVEWAGYNGNDDACPACGADAPLRVPADHPFHGKAIGGKHTPECELDAALRKAGVR